MPCYHPITCWFSAEKNPSGRRSLVFSPDGAFGDAFQVSCGTCLGCRLRRAQDWSVRLTHEAQFHDQRSFLTLTYSPERLPADGSLSVRTLQLFFKRLRNAATGGRCLGAYSPVPVLRNGLRYFAVGEYGAELGRPHYHVILFGLDFREDRRVWGKSKDGEHTRYVSKRLDAIWGLGRAEIGSVTVHSAGYCARYSLKKVSGEFADEHYGSLHPEFMVCSKGIGSKWFEKYASDLNGDFVVMKGKKFPVPAYYDRMLEEGELESLKSRRKEGLRPEDRWNATPARLRVREEVTAARIRSLTPQDGEY